MRHSTAALLGLSGVVLTAVSIAEAIERKPVPIFQVATTDGRVVASRNLSPEPQWLLVYTTVDCPACDRLLDALNAWRALQLPARVVVLVGGDPTRVFAYLRARTSDASSLRLYADAQGQAQKALSLAGSPVLIGIRAGEIEWVLGGVLNDPSALESVVRKWVEY